jgi:hypothetical protein
MTERFKPLVVNRGRARSVRAFDTGGACPGPCWRESGREHEANMDRVKCYTSDRLQSIAWAPNYHVNGFASWIIVGSRFDDWIYWTSVLQLQLIITAHTLNSFYTTSIWRISHCCLNLDWSLVLRILDLWISAPRIHYLWYLLGGPHRRHHVEQLIILCCSIGCPVGYPGNFLWNNLLPGIDSFAVLCCNGNECLFSLWSATDVLVWFHYFGFQTSCHSIIMVENLPNGQQKRLCPDGFFSNVLSLSFLCQCSFQTRQVFVETS